MSPSSASLHTPTTNVNGHSPVGSGSSSSSHHARQRSISIEGLTLAPDMQSPPFGHSSSPGSSGLLDLLHAHPHHHHHHSHHHNPLSPGHIPDVNTSPPDAPSFLGPTRPQPPLPLPPTPPPPPDSFVDEPWPDTPVTMIPAASSSVTVFSPSSSSPPQLFPPPLALGAISAASTFAFPTMASPIIEGPDSPARRIPIDLPPTSVPLSHLGSATHHHVRRTSAGARPGFLILNSIASNATHGARASSIPPFFRYS